MMPSPRPHAAQSKGVFAHEAVKASCSILYINIVMCGDRVVDPQAAEHIRKRLARKFRRREA